MAGRSHDRRNTRRDVGREKKQMPSSIAEQARFGAATVSVTLEDFQVLYLIRQFLSKGSLRASDGASASHDQIAPT